VERLRRRDLDVLLSCLHEIYAHHDLGDFASRVVAVLPDAIPSEWTSYNEVDAASQTLNVAMNPMPPNFSEFQHAFERHVPEHPIIGHHLRTRDGRALKISDFLTRREFHRLGLYNEFYRKLEVEHQIAVVLPSPSPLVIEVALNRSRRDFSERERVLLDVLRPHLVQARRNAASATGLRQERPSGPAKTPLRCRIQGYVGK
jgi:hypothetical protein